MHVILLSKGKGCMDTESFIVVFHFIRTYHICIWWTRCKEGMLGVLTEKMIVFTFQKIKMKSLSLLFFWCKQELLGESTEMVDFIKKL